MFALVVYYFTIVLRTSSLFFLHFTAWISASTMDSDENDGDRSGKRRRLLLPAVEGPSTSGLRVSLLKKIG